MKINALKKIAASFVFIWVINFNLIDAANAAVYTVLTGPDARKWTVDGDSILEVTTTTATGELINGNGLDAQSLRVTIGSVDFFDGLDAFGDIEFNNASLIRGDGARTQLFQFEENWVRVRATSVTEAPINVSSNLGSDLETIFTTIDGKLFSYKKNGNNMDSGPIFQWETDGTLTNPTIDSVQINKTGTSLDLKLYVYAHDITNNLLVNRVDYLQQFALFAGENRNRTDTFIYVAPPAPAPAPAPAPVYVRQTSNLTFAQSLYASDTLSDPDGELRKTVDQIMAKYGSLIK
jgi:hypothetical protein